MTNKQLRGKETEDLQKMLDTNREELMNLRFQKATGALENTARVAQVKREVARIHTVLNERTTATAVTE